MLDSRQALRQQLGHARASAALSRAASREPLLRRLSSLRDVETLLGVSSPLKFTEKNALLAALLRVYVRNEDPYVLCALMLAMFLPLRRVAKRLSHLAPEDAHQEVALAFIEVCKSRETLKDMRMPFVRLTQRVQRRLFRDDKVRRNGGDIPTASPCPSAADGHGGVDPSSLLLEAFDHVRAALEIDDPELAHNIVLELGLLDANAAHFATEHGLPKHQAYRLKRQVRKALMKEITAA